jgi:hypothetical protein
VPELHRALALIGQRIAPHENEPRHEHAGGQRINRTDPRVTDPSLAPHEDARGQRQVKAQAHRREPYEHRQRRESREPAHHA